MKTNLLLLLITFFSAKLLAQCDVIPLHTGMEWQLQMFNAKDKQTGTITYKVTNVTTDGAFTVATVHMDMTDEKGKALNNGDYTFKCKADEFMIDMHNFLSGQLDAYKNMEVKGDATYLEFPKDLTVGGTLPDGTMHMDIFNNGTLFTTMDINITNRKVVSKESVTVPAGTFDCYKISSDNSIKTTTMGIGIPITSSTIDYFSVGNWFVRSETYNKNGKLTGYMVLSSFKK